VKKYIAPFKSNATAINNFQHGGQEDITPHSTSQKKNALPCKSKY
jgi:hypothetical protein